MMKRLSSALAGALLALATAAGAEPSSAPPARDLDAAVWRAGRAASPARGQSLPPGVARTAVERRADRVTASAGFLCGRDDIAVRDGSAGAYDHDPQGRFVGASLRLSF